MPKRIKIRPTNKVKQQFSNTANKVHKKNVAISTARGGVRL